MTRQEAAVARAAGIRAQTDRPSQRRHAQDEAVASPARTIASFEVRSSSSAAAPQVFGIASVTGKAYEMWDMFGPYTEVVAETAFDETLAADPLVEFTLNHGAGGGLPMASTRAGSLELNIEKGTETSGLHFAATVNPSRGDVADMLHAMRDGDLAEASFKFRIVRGQWSPDWMEYHIEEVDIDRGDVSAVNFGANPYAMSGLKELAKPEIVTPARTPVVIPDDVVARRVVIGAVDTRHRSITA